MHRSGTSLSASLLDRTGLYMGNDMVEPATDNIRGFFEDVEFYNLNVSILGRNKLNYLVKKPVNIWIDADIKEKAIQLIHKRQKHNNWGWKDPRTTLLLNFWKQIIPNAKVVILFRDYEEVVSSLHRRNKKISIASPLDTIPGEHFNIFKIKYYYLLSKIKRVFIKITPRIYKKYDFLIGDSLRSFRGSFANIYLTMKYIKTWNLYNKQALEFYNKNRDDCLLISLDSFLKYPLEVINFIVTKWGFNLSRTVTLDSVYEKRLLHRNNKRYLRLWLTLLCSEIEKTHSLLLKAEKDTLNKIQEKNEP